MNLLNLNLFSLKHFSSRNLYFWRILKLRIYQFRKLFQRILSEPVEEKLKISSQNFIRMWLPGNHSQGIIHFHFINERLIFQRLPFSDWMVVDSRNVLQEESSRTRSSS